LFKDVTPLLVALLFLESGSPELGNRAGNSSGTRTLAPTEWPLFLRYTKPGRKFGERFTWFFQSSLLLVKRRDPCAASIFPLES